jgi:hypothetical protein
MSHANYANRVQPGNGQSIREYEIYFFGTIQREEVSSLSPAGFARHPPPTSAGLFLPATPTLKATAKPLRGAPPLAPASRVPNLPRCACADLRSRSAPSIPLRCIARVGRPLGLQLLPPAFARWRSACMSHATATTTAKAKEQRP